MKKIMTIVTLLVVVFVTTSCCGCRISNTKQLTTLLNNQWKLTELPGVDDITSAEDSYTISFDTKEGRAFGVADCNRYFGSYTIADKNKLSFGAMGSTLMACPNNSLEQQYLKMLSNVNSYLVDGDTLMLMNNGTLVATFKVIKK